MSDKRVFSLDELIIIEDRANEVLKFLFGGACENESGTCEMTDCVSCRARQIINSLKKQENKVDAEPVRHGWWKQITDADREDWALHECSECGNEVDMPTDYHDPFCLYCGAKMDKVIGDADSD